MRWDEMKPDQRRWSFISPSTEIWLRVLMIFTSASGTWDPNSLLMAPCFAPAVGGKLHLIINQFLTFRISHTIKVLGLGLVQAAWGYRNPDKLFTSLQWQLTTLLPTLLPVKADITALSTKRKKMRVWWHFNTFSASVCQKWRFNWVLKNN